MCLFYGESTSRSIPQVASLFSSPAFWLDWRSWKCGADQYTFASNRRFWWGQKISQMINGGLNWEKFQNCCLNGKTAVVSLWILIRFVWANPCVWALSVCFLFSAFWQEPKTIVQDHTYIWVLFGVHLSIVNGAVPCLKLLQCAST